MRVLLPLLLSLTLAACAVAPDNNQIVATEAFTSTDKAYGFSADKPVNLGGFLRGTQYEGAHIEYFDNLRGPAGQLVQAIRLGSCCPFEDSSLPFGGGLLDMYELRYDGLAKPVVIYVNLYKFEQPLAPSGFSLL